jgi:hypothetical protein
MPVSPPRRRVTLADIMLLVASTAGLFAVVQACGSTIDPFEQVQAIITAAALFLSFGGYGACAARRRGRSRFEGFRWGFIFGPIGVLMIGLMPHPPDD